MTPAEHYAKAEQLLEMASQPLEISNTAGQPDDQAFQNLVAAASIHATLATVNPVTAAAAAEVA